jgi:hypothetical protein
MTPEPPAATSERHDGPTPNGGAYAIAYFFDDARNPAPKDQATGVEVVEFDSRGEAIHRTSGTLEKPSGPPDEHPGF